MPDTFMTHPVSPQHHPSLKHSARQRGVSLIELMVGLAIGLLTIAVALGTLLMSRNVSSTVSDVSQLQQQAAYAFRLIGRQLRQAGSLRLNPAVQKAPGQTLDMSDPVAFETDYEDFKTSQSIAGADTPSGNEFKLKVGYRNYQESLYNASADASLQRNCLGEENSSSLIESRFVFDSTNHLLKCTGTASVVPKTVIDNVAKFEVRYLYQADPTQQGSPELQLVAASAVSDWSKVTAAEVCLVLFGNDRLDLPSGTTYTDCDGTSSVNMSTLTGSRASRAHMVFRTMYQLRSQGLVS